MEQIEQRPNLRKNLPTTALVTGTTSGIGKAFVELLASEGWNLILVSRDLRKLNLQQRQLEHQFNVECEVIQADLAIEEDLNRVSRRLLDDHRPVTVLVNNAGFGLNRDFGVSQLSDQVRLTRVLVIAPLELCHSAIQSMKKSGGGYIINVSSVAAFMTGGTYCAAKSWLNTFSESLSGELGSSGINVYAVCPGFTRTEFHMRCSQDVSGVPNFMWLKPERVAREAWGAVQRGKRLSIPSLQYKMLVSLHRFAPRWLVHGYATLAKRFLRRGGRNS